jgi:hypothetical protein
MVYKFQVEVKKWKSDKNVNAFKVRPTSSDGNAEAR